MKKYIIVYLSCIIFFSLFSCKKKEDPVPEDAPAIEEATVQSQQNFLEFSTISDFESEISRIANDTSSNPEKSHRTGFFSMYDYYQNPGNFRSSSSLPDKLPIDDDLITKLLSPKV